MNLISKLHHKFKSISKIILYQWLLGKPVDIKTQNKSLYLYRRVDIIFFQSYRKLCNYTKLIFAFHLIKIITSLSIVGIVLTRSMNQKQIISQEQLILILNLICLDSIKIFQSFSLIKMLNNLKIFLDIASQLDHCQFINNSISLSDDKISYEIQTSVNVSVYDFHPILNMRRSRFKLMRQIKYCYYIKQRNLIYFEIIISILYQGYGILAIYMIKIYQYIPNTTNILMHNYLIYITLISWYIPYVVFVALIVAQLITFTIFTIGLLTIFPLVLCFQLWNYIKKKKQQLRKKLVIKKFIPIIFQNQNVNQQLDCKICMETINNSDLIIKLPCNQLHLFHKQCLQTWWRKTKFNCPYCRQSYQQVKQQLTQYFQI